MCLRLEGEWVSAMPYRASTLVLYLVIELWASQWSYFGRLSGGIIIIGPTTYSGGFALTHCNTILCTLYPISWLIEDSTSSLSRNNNVLLFVMVTFPNMYSGRINHSETKMQHCIKSNYHSIDTRMCSIGPIWDKNMLPMPTVYWQRANEQSGSKILLVFLPTQLFFK